MKNKYLLSVVETSRQYNVGRDYLYGLIRSGNSDLPYLRIRGHVKINAPLFEAWLDEKSRMRAEL